MSVKRPVADVSRADYRGMVSIKAPMLWFQSDEISYAQYCSSRLKDDCLSLNSTNRLFNEIDQKTQQLRKQQNWKRIHVEGKKKKKKDKHKQSTRLEVPHLQKALHLVHDQCSTASRCSKKFMAWFHSFKFHLFISYIRLILQDLSL